MEAFKVFATFSVIDMLSDPLNSIRKGMASVEGRVASLSNAMGRLALAMAPVAMAAGVLLGVFSACAGSAMAFESAMADVAKVVEFESTQELKAMGDAVKELSGRLPMASDGIAAIVAAAGQTGVAKNDLVEFAEQAAKMGIAFDLTGDQAGKMMADWRAGMKLSLPQVYALADAVNHLSNNMNATAPDLGEVMQRVGALAMSAGLAETQVAALGTAFLSAGASPQIVATAMRNMISTLVQGEAMTKSAADAFKGLGFSAKQMALDMQNDAQGTIFKVLQAIADKPKELQLSLLSTMFGESALSAIAPLLGNMDNLSKAFDLVGDSAQFAGSMQAEFEARSNTAENALQLLRNRLNNLSISIGAVFLPAIKWGANALGQMADALRWVVDTPFGQWLVKGLGALSAGVIAITSVATALWGVGRLAPLMVKALLPLKAALLGLSWPVWLVIAAVGALYLAYKKNFGGMADTLNRWANNIKLVFQGVVAVFENLKGSSSEIRGELATEIKAAGLEGLVVTVGRVVYRIRAFFTGLWEGIDFTRPLRILEPVGEKIGNLLEKLGQIFSKVFGGEVTSATETFSQLGAIVGGAVTFAFEVFATVINSQINSLSMLIDFIRLIIAVFTGDWQGAIDSAISIWDTLVDTFMSFADLFRIGDWIRDAWSEASEFLSSIDLYESGAAIIETLKAGIMAKVDSLVDSVQGVLSTIRDYLPFSDAKVGPLSELTLSGSKIMTTLAEGVVSGAGSLVGTMSQSLQNLSGNIASWWDGLFSDKEDFALNPGIQAVPASSAHDEPIARNKDRSDQQRQSVSYTIHIGQVVLPNATNAEGFVSALENLITEYDGEVPA